MKKIKTFLFTAIVIGLLVSCFPQASQVIRSLPVETKEQILAQYNEEQIAEGKAIFTSKCVKCHSLKEPESRTAAAWTPIMKKMIPRAKLSDEEGKLARAYAIVNAKE